MIEIIKFYLKSLSSIKFKHKYFISVLFNFIDKFLVVFESIILSQIIVVIFYQENNNIKNFCYFLIMCIICEGIKFFLEKYNITFQKKINVNIKKDFLYKLLDTPLYELENLNDGKIFNIVMEDTLAIYGYLNKINNLILNTIFLSIFTFLISIKYPCIILLILFFAIIQYIINLYSKKRLKKIFKEAEIANDDFIYALKHIIQNFQEIYNNNACNILYDYIVHKLNLAEDVFVKRDLLHQKIRMISIWIQNISYIVTAFFVSYIMMENNLSEIIFVVILSKHMNQLIVNIMSNLRNLQGDLVKLDRYFGIVELIEEIEQYTQRIMILDNVEKISVQEISLSKASKSIFENLSIDFKKGEITKIVGNNGVGKTSLMKVICGIYKVEKGMVFFNDTELTFINPLWIRENICFVSENPIIFHLSILDNILLSDDSDKCDISKVIEVCKLINIHEDIMKMQNRYNTIITSNFKLSAGQKKKIQLARCMLKDKRIILLDEPWVNLDISTRLEVEKWLKIQQREKIIICISHEKELLDHDFKIIKMSEV